jgi:myosin heavy subunit
MRNDFADAWKETKATWNFSELGARRAMKKKAGDKKDPETHDAPSEPDAAIRAFNAPGPRSKPGSPAPGIQMSTTSLGEQLISKASAGLGLTERAATRRKPLRTHFSFESLVADFGSTFELEDRLNTHAQPDHDGEVPSHISTSNTDKMMGPMAQVTSTDVLTIERELWRIRELVIRKGYEFPELKPAEDASAEVCVSQTLDEYRTVSEKLQYESRMHQEASVQLRNLQDIEETLRATQIDLRDTKGKVVDRDSSLEAAQKDNEKRERRHMLDLRQLNGTIELQERKMSDLARTHEAQMGARHSSLVQEIARLKSLHDQQMQQLRTQNVTEYERAKQNADNTISRLQQESGGLQQRLNAMEHDHQRRMTSAKEDYTNRLKEKDRSFEQQLNAVNEANRVALVKLQLQIDQLNNDVATEKLHSQERLRLQEKRLTEAHEDDLREHDKDVERLREDIRTQKTSLSLAHTQELSLLEQKLQNEKTRLAMQHQKDAAQLRFVAEELKGALVVRDHYKGLKDRDLAGRYKRLSTEIEGFSSMDWDARRETTWPLSEADLLRLHPKNTRKLKQQMVQHSIWLLLHESIFSLPFMILGKEGVPLNSAWTKIYASGKWHQNRPVLSLPD